MDRILKTDTREITHFREQLSRIIRQVDLIKKGNVIVKSTGESRLDIIQKCAIDIDNICKKIQ